LDEAMFFLEKLSEDKMPLGSVVFNRFHPSPVDLSMEELKALTEKAIDALPKYAPAVDGLMENLKAFSLLSKTDEMAMTNFLSKATLVITPAKVPFLDHDVHDISGLLEIAGHLK